MGKKHEWKFKIMLPDMDGRMNTRVTNPDEVSSKLSKMGAGIALKTSPFKKGRI